MGVNTWLLSRMNLENKSDEWLRGTQEQLYRMINVCDESIPYGGRLESSAYKEIDKCNEQLARIQSELWRRM
jgi:hypothetical protein